MKKILNRLINQETISRAEAKEVLVNISKGKYNTSQIASFLTVYMMRNITLDELSGFRDALQEHCVRVPLDDCNAIDLCGTGGDGKDTFNISTLASFVTAGAGVQVTKHGNYGVSSVCGSSNVLEYLGIRFSDNFDFLRRSIEETNICFLHAPKFHPAMKNVAPIRRELAVKTFFNMLGPMINPAFPKNQMVGVYSLELARVYGYLYQNTDTNYAIINSLDGYDEISLTGGVKIITNESEQTLYPEDFGLEMLGAEDIFGGDSIESSATIFMEVLRGKGTVAQENVVCANAGVAIATVEKISFKQGIQRAKESLNDGKALAVFEKLKTLSN